MACSSVDDGSPVNNDLPFTSAISHMDVVGPRLNSRLARTSKLSRKAAVGY